MLHCTWGEINEEPGIVLEPLSPDPPLTPPHFLCSMAKGWRDLASRHLSAGTARTQMGDLNWGIYDPSLYDTLNRLYGQEPEGEWAVTSAGEGGDLS